MINVTLLVPLLEPAVRPALPFFPKWRNRVRRLSIGAMNLLRFGKRRPISEVGNAVPQMQSCISKSGIGRYTPETREDLISDRPKAQGREPTQGFISRVMDWAGMLNSWETTADFDLHILCLSSAIISSLKQLDINRRTVM